jgi:PAS domain S-box-containing protein
MSDTENSQDQGLLSILEGMSDGFCAVDRQWQLVYINGQGERITHQAKAQLLGKPIWDAFPETIGSIFHQHYHRKEAVDQKLRFEFFCHSIDAWLEVHSVPSPFGLAFYFHDITQQRRSLDNIKDLSDSLFAERAYLDSLLQHIPGGVVICEAPTGRVLYGNERVQKIFGRPGGVETEIENYTKWEGFHPDGNRYEPNEWPLARSISTGEIVSGEEIHVKAASGKTHVLLVSSSPIRDKSGKILAGIVIDHDISDRHKYAFEIKELAARESEARKGAETASKAKDHFIAVLSHELRTPLTPVSLALGAMEIGDDLPADLRQDVAMMRRNVELELRLIDDLLDVSRITSGKMRLDLLPTSLNPLIENVVEILLEAATAKQQTISVQLNAQNDGITGDGARLQQVFWNVLKNAIKFGSANSEIVIRTSNPTPTNISIEITNKGEGISAIALTQIFNAFEQANAKVESQFGGLGLGLAISRAILDLHGGSISASSDGPGQGACFTINLETQAGEPKLISQTIKSPPASGINSIRLLVVEDHEDTRGILCRLLAAKGYIVAQAATVAAAIAHITAHPIDLLVSDIGLPDASGLDLMRQFRKLQSAPAIAVSGYGSESDIQASLDAGFEMHLTKPLDIHSLFKAIASLFPAGNSSPGSLAIAA